MTNQQPSRSKWVRAALLLVAALACIGASGFAIWFVTEGLRTASF